MVSFRTLSDEALRELALRVKHELEFRLGREREEGEGDPEPQGPMLKCGDCKAVFPGDLDDVYECPDCGSWEISEV